jgi:hypothetical protein
MQNQISDAPMCVPAQEPIPESQWRWFGGPMHFIGGAKCVFHLATQVGSYLVSTVGNYRPDGVDQPMARIGFERYYETMVFTLSDQEKSCGCPEPSSWNQVESYSYRLVDCNEIEDGHLRMCRKYAAMGDSA